MVESVKQPARTRSACTFIHWFNKLLLGAYNVLSTVIGARDAAMSKADKTLVLMELQIGAEGAIGHHHCPESPWSWIFPGCEPPLTLPMGLECGEWRVRCITPSILLFSLRAHRRTWWCGWVVNIFWDGGGWGCCWKSNNTRKMTPDI